MANHSERFLKIVDEAKQRIKECDIHAVKAKLDSGSNFHLIDCREDNEWQKDHLPQAQHIGKGVIERDIEQLIPNLDADIIIYCGGGYRSALASANLMKMGYKNVVSMDGGIRGWREAGYPTVRD